MNERAAANWLGKKLRRPEATFEPRIVMPNGQCEPDRWQDFKSGAQMIVKLANRQNFSAQCGVSAGEYVDAVCSGKRFSLVEALKENPLTFPIYTTIRHSAQSIPIPTAPAQIKIVYRRFYLSL